MANATLPKVSFQPLRDKVLIKPLEKEEVKRSGIIIPDTAKEKPQEGTVIVTGPGHRDKDGKIVPMDVKAGDVVLYGKYAGTEIKINDEEFILVTEEDIQGILK